METSVIQCVDLPTVFWFVHYGFSVIPCHLGSKIPRIKWGVYKDRLPSDDELLRWFRVPSNGAVVTGTNNLVVIDFDDIGEYIRWSLWAGTANPIAQSVLRNAYKVRTSRGIHVYTRSTANVGNLHVGKIDIKGRGGLVTLPGSVHPSGAIYTVYQEGGFPIWGSLTEVLPKETVDELERVQTVTPVREAGYEIDRNLTPSQVLDMSVSVDLAAVKRSHRIEDFLGEITWTGEHWGVTQCPFHEDNNPSFWVDTERQLCGCFSGCTAKPLDVVNLFARINNISNQEAIRRLGERL